MWIATSLLRYRGRVYRKGDAVPADDPHHRRSFERLGRITWVEDVAPETAESKPETGGISAYDGPNPDVLNTMTRAELNEYAASVGIDDPASYPNKPALIEALSGHDDDEGDTA